MKRRALGCVRARVAAACLGVVLAAGGVGAERLEQSFEVEPDVRVDIEIVSGRVEVRGIAANRVNVEARGGRVEIDVGEGWLSLRAPFSGWRPWTWGEVDVRLEVEVPYASHVTVRSVNGPIEVEDVDGVLDLHAANGAIEVVGAPREAHLETLNSSIRFEGDASEVVARTLNGEIELRGVAREVEATSMSGSIRVEGDDLERAELRSMAGDIELDASLAPGARVHGKSYSGRVSLRLPEDLSARFEIESYSGDLRSEFVARGDEKGRGDRWERRGSGDRLQYSVGTGDARIAIDSFSGGVRIERDDGSAREARRERRQERREKRAERREEQTQADADADADQASRSAD